MEPSELVKPEKTNYWILDGHDLSMLNKKGLLLLISCEQYPIYKKNTIPLHYNNISECELRTTVYYDIKRFINSYNVRQHLYELVETRDNKVTLFLGVVSNGVASQMLDECPFQAAKSGVRAKIYDVQPLYPYNAEKVVGRKYMIIPSKKYRPVKIQRVISSYLDIGLCCIAKGNGKNYEQHTNIIFILGGISNDLQFDLLRLKNKNTTYMFDTERPSLSREEVNFWLLNEEQQKSNFKIDRLCVFGCNAVLLKQGSFRFWRQSPFSNKHPWICPKNEIGDHCLRDFDMVKKLVEDCERVKVAWGDRVKDLAQIKAPLFNSTLQLIDYYEKRKRGLSIK
jgi:hypothetical protein